MPRRAPQRVMRVVLNRDIIVHTAAEIVESQGAEALSMRAVGQELGVTAMAIYRHVANKDELIKAIGEYVMAGLDLPSSSGDGWRVDARNLVRGFRAIAQEYPRCLALVLQRRGIPVGMRAIEQALELCAQAGMDGVSSVRMTRALMAYTLGTQLWESGQRRALRAADHRMTRQPLDAAGFPRLAKVHDELVVESGEADFEFGLDLFLSAVEERIRSDG